MLILRHPTLLLGLMLLGSGCARQGEAPAANEKHELLPFGAFSPPAANQPLSGQVVVGGWAIHESGIASVSLYLDRQYLLDANIGLDRPDVAAIYGTFNKNAAISGWNAMLDTPHLPAGPHELIAEVRSKSGSQRDFTIPIVIAKAQKSK